MEFPKVIFDKESYCVEYNIVATAAYINIINNNDDDNNNNNNNNNNNYNNNNNN